MSMSFLSHFRCFLFFVSMYSTFCLLVLFFHKIYLFFTFYFSLLGKGAVAASMLGYVLPGVLYLSTYKKEARDRKSVV